MQRERQKIGKTTIPHVHHAFLYISFLTLHDYDVKMPNFRFCGRCEHKTTFFFFSWTSIQSFRIQLQKNCQHLRKELKNLKFEVAQLHFLSDVSLLMLKLLLSSWTTSLFKNHSGLCLQQDLTCLNIIAPSYPYIAYLLFAFLFQLYLGTCAHAI